VNHLWNRNESLDESADAEQNGFNNNNNTNNNELANENSGNPTDDYDITEDLMQLFSVVNIRIQKVFLNFLFIFIK
jgi:hypothetical protein